MEDKHTTTEKVKQKSKSDNPGEYVETIRHKQDKAIAATIWKYRTKSDPVQEFYVFTMSRAWKTDAMKDYQYKQFYFGRNGDAGSEVFKTAADRCRELDKAA